MAYIRHRLLAAQEETHNKYAPKWQERISRKDIREKIERKGASPVRVLALATIVGWDLPPADRIPLVDGGSIGMGIQPILCSMNQIEERL